MTLNLNNIYNNIRGLNGCLIERDFFSENTSKLSTFTVAKIVSRELNDTLE